MVGQGLHHTSFTTPCITHSTSTSFVSLLPWPCSWRDALCSQVCCRGTPLTHVVRDAFCEGDEGIAEVREQHRYPPSAFAVREYGGNVVGVQAVSLEIMQNVTSTIRAIYLPCVQCGRTLHRGVLHPGVPVMWYGHIRDLFPTAEGCMESRLPNVTLLHWAQQKQCTGVM